MHQGGGVLPWSTGGQLQSLTGPHQGKEEPKLFTIPQQTGRAETGV